MGTSLGQYWRVSHLGRRLESSASFCSRELRDNWFVCSSNQANAIYRNDTNTVLPLLHNLSKHEYVRGQAFAVDRQPDMAEGKFGAIGLRHTL